MSWYSQITRQYYCPDDVLINQKLWESGDDIYLTFLDLLFGSSSCLWEAPFLYLKLALSLKLAQILAVVCWRSSGVSPYISLNTVSSFCSNRSASFMLKHIGGLNLSTLQSGPSALYIILSSFSLQQKHFQQSIDFILHTYILSPCQFPLSIHGFFQVGEWNPKAVFPS